MSKQYTRKHWYNLKVPAKGGRATFALVEVNVETRKARTVRDPVLEQVNRDHCSGTAFEICLDRAKRVLDNYRDKERPPKRVFMSENMDVLQEYWDTDYVFRDLPEKTRRGMWRRLENAVRALGKVSLRTGTPDQVHKQLVSLKLDPSTHNEYVARLLQLLRYAANQMKVPRKPEPNKIPIHITEEEFLAREAKAPEPVRSYAGLLFYSGIRASEAFDLKESSYQGDNALYVETQFSDTGEVKAPKRGSVRHAYLFDEGVPFFKDWIKNDLHSIRNVVRWGEELQKYFGVDSYALRHSFALYCIGIGIEPDWIIRSMGTSKTVFYKHYSGRVHTKSTIQAMAASVRSKRKK